MAKKITGYVNLVVPAGKANPAPPIGTALGPRGVNIMEFCKAFNAETQGVEVGTPLPTLMTIYADRTFSFIIKTPPASFLIRKIAKLQKGSKEPGRIGAGKITMDQVREVATMKMKDLNAYNMEAACEMIKGSAKSMGVEVVGE